MGFGGSARRIRTALGGAAARNGPRHRALQVSAAQRVPAPARRHAGLSTRGAAAVVRLGRGPSPATVIRIAGRFAAAVGSSRGVSDRAAAPRGVAAPGTQSAASTGGAAERKRPHREYEIAAGLDEGSPAHSRGSRARARVLEGGGFSLEYRLSAALLRRR